MPRKNYYEIFKLYPPVDPDQLRDTYKQLIFEHHPDRNPERLEWAIERTMEIVEAYNVLSDPEKREIYTFQIRIDIRREPGPSLGVKKALIKIGRSKEDVTGEEHFLRGVTYFEDKDNWNQAQHEWQQALKYLPGLKNAYYNLGVLFGCQGAFKDSLTAFHHVLKMDPSDLEAKKAHSMVMGYVYGKKAV